MKFPKTIPVERIEEYHTHYLGTFGKRNIWGQARKFWGYTTFVFTKPYSEIVGDWQDYRNEYAILHIFDKNGKHVETKHWFGGTTKQIDNVALDRKLEEMIHELGEIKFEDIKIELFQVEIDGVVFGLIPNEEFESIDLQPSSTISFSEPWDGSYDT